MTFVYCVSTPRGVAICGGTPLRATAGKTWYFRVPTVNFHRRQCEGSQERCPALIPTSTGLPSGPNAIPARRLGRSVCLLCKRHTALISTYELLQLYWTLYVVCTTQNMKRGVMIDLPTLYSEWQGLSPTRTRQVTLHKTLTATVCLSNCLLLPGNAQRFLLTNFPISWMLSTLWLTSCSIPNFRRFLISLPSYHLFLLKNNTKDKHAFYFCDWSASERGSSVLGWPIMREKLRKFYSLSFNWTFCGTHRESYYTLVQGLYREFVNAKLWSWTELPKI